MDAARPSHEKLHQRLAQLEQELSEAREAEEKFKTEAERFRFLAESSSDILLSVDAQGRYMYVSPSHERLLGRGIEVLGRSVFEHIHPDDVGYVRCHFEDALKSGEQVRVEYRYQHPHSGYIWLESVGQRHDMPGSPLKAVITSRDITERKRLEEDLRLHSLTLDQIEDRVTVTDLDGHITYINEKECTMLGRPREELIGQHVSTYGEDPSKGATQEEIIRRTREDGFWRGEVVNYTADGSERILDCRTHVVRDQAGQPVALCGIATDITDRKAAESALKESEERFRAFMENLPAGIMLIDSATRTIESVNKHTESLFGAAKEQILGNRCHKFICDASEEGCPICDLGQTIDNSEREIVRQDGSRLPVFKSVTRMSINGREKLLECFVDIADRKKAEAVLIEAKKQAEKANKAKSEFLANMSHEIRTPLNGIMGMMQVLQLSELTEEQHEYVDMAIKSSKRLARLLSDILDLSKIEADKMDIQERAFQLDEVLESVEEVFSQVAMRYGNTIQITSDRNLPEWLKGDSTRLTQILFNLAGNAVKYTQNGQVEVQVSLLRRDQPGQCNVLFAVSDNGQGIPEDKLEHVFQTFTQMHDSSSPYTRQYQGAGLGLPLVKRLVKLMGGAASIASQPGEGTTVYVSLPFQVPEWLREDRSGQHDEAASKDLRSREVLLVDDDEVSRLHIRRLLEKQGANVFEAADGQQALDYLESRSFHCVLMDVQMPVLDGVEATKRLRSAQGGCRNIPIIALTAYAMTGDRERFLATGMDDYLAKPVEREELVAAIRRNLTGMGAG